MAEPVLEISCRCPALDKTTYNTNSEQTPATAVLDAVAQAEGVGLLDLPPLYDAVDPAMLDRLFDDDVDEATVLKFQYEDWNIFIRGDGRIRTCDATTTGEHAPVFERSLP